MSDCIIIYDVVHKPRKESEKNKSCPVDDTYVASPGAPPSTRTTSPKPVQNDLNQTELLCLNHLTERHPASSPSAEMPLSQPEGATGGLGIFCWHYGCLNRTTGLES